MNSFFKSKTSTFSKFNFSKIIFLATTLVAFIGDLTISENAFGNDKNQLSNFNSNFSNYNNKIEIFSQKNIPVTSFNIAIADTQEKQHYGLMNLEQLPENYGMIFTYKKPLIINMWMKDTKIPLDMIFIKNNKIIKIIEETIPYSLDLISSERETDIVLEINAKMIRKYGIKVGQKIKIKKTNR